MIRVLLDAKLKIIESHELADNLIDFTTKLKSLKGRQIKLWRLGIFKYFFNSFNFYIITWLYEWNYGETNRKNQNILKSKGHPIGVCLLMTFSLWLNLIIFLIGFPHSLIKQIYHTFGTQKLSIIKYSYILITVYQDHFVVEKFFIWDFILCKFGRKTFS